ncbi:MAG TPA: hypothetical protein VFG93_03580, partial [Gaiellaceae bacterium]|nr:hypothetical protein [Gaiellaceae bacterium]
ERPWATVLRVPVARGQVWFKACGAVEAFEPRLTASLFERSPDRIAEVLGYDAERGWFLLADAGTPVRPPAARKVDDLRRVARPAALALAPYSWSFCEPGGHPPQKVEQMTRRRVTICPQTAPSARRHAMRRVPFGDKVLQARDGV